jgi:hypothetical protein
MKAKNKLLLSAFVAIATISTQSNLHAMQETHLEETALLEKLDATEKAAYDCLRKMVSTDANYNNIPSIELIEKYFVSVVEKLNYSEQIYQLRNALKNARTVRHTPLDYNSQAENIFKAFEIYAMIWLRHEMNTAIKHLGTILFPDY